MGHAARPADIERRHARLIARSGRESKRAACWAPPAYVTDCPLRVGVEPAAEQSGHRLWFPVGAYVRYRL